MPSGVTTLESVSCVSALHCLAVGEYLEPAPTDTRPGVVVATNDGGKSWARQVTTMTGELVSVSCANAFRCIAVGLAGQNGSRIGSFALTTDNGGRSWTNRAIAGTTLTLSAVSCPTSQACVAVGSTTAAVGSGNPVALVTTDDGARWRRAVAPGHDIALNNVSCPDAEHCVATGTSQPPSTAPPTKSVPVVLTSSDGGERWARRPLPLGGSAGSVACLKGGRCLATGANAPLLSRDYGQTWTLASRSAGFSTNVASVACPTAGLRSCGGR